MKSLFHAFPRPRHSIEPATGRVIRRPLDEQELERGFRILELILRHGILCSPERFTLPSAAANGAASSWSVSQSRACFTLLDAIELTQEYSVGGGFVTHVDLFGPFAIGLDALAARELGVLPTVYYYPHDHAGRHEKRRVSGLAQQIVEKLQEIRTILATLSYIEAKADRGDLRVPAAKLLEVLGISLPSEEKIASKIDSLGSIEARRIFEYFDTDRVPSWNAYDFVTMLLSAYQTTDSTLENAPLAFFQQREWRLIHHSREGLRWFSLGENHPMADPERAAFAQDKQAVLEFVSGGSAARSQASYLKRCWVLHSADGRHIREFVSEIVAPKEYRKKVETLLASLPFRGASPRVIDLPPRWKTQWDGRGVPELVQGGV